MNPLADACANTKVEIPCTELPPSSLLLRQRPNLPSNEGSLLSRPTLPRPPDPLALQRMILLLPSPMVWNIEATGAQGPAVRSEPDSLLIAASRFRRLTQEIHTCYWSFEHLAHSRHPPDPLCSTIHPPVSVFRSVELPCSPALSLYGETTSTSLLRSPSLSYTHASICFPTPCYPPEQGSAVAPLRSLPFCQK